MSTNNILNRLGGSTAPVKPTDQNSADTDNKGLGPLLNEKGEPIAPNGQPIQDGDPNTIPRPGENMAGSSLGTVNSGEVTGPAEQQSGAAKDPTLGNAPERGNTDNTEATYEQLDQGLAGVHEVGVAGSVGKPQVQDLDFRITQEAPISSTRRGPRSEEQARAEDAGEVEAEVIEPVGAYKHRSVRHFVVGGFEFKNNILLIYTAEANERFLDLYDQLEARDKNAIVEYDWKAAQRVEQPVMVARGAMATSRIKDSKVVKS